MIRTAIGTFGPDRAPGRTVIHGCRLDSTWGSEVSRSRDPSTEDRRRNTSGGTSEREARLASAFVQLADTLVEDFDVVDFLQLLSERCVGLLAASEAAVVLADATETLQVMAASSSHSHTLELLQLQNQEGPCLDCFQEAAPVVSTDLPTDRDRWPRFVPAALDLGYHGILALPLRLRDRVLGGLNLFYDQAGEAVAADRVLGQALADIATIGLVQERTVRESLGLADQLQTALNARIAIEQAKGVLSERAGLEVDQAYERLRGYARSHNRRLREVAHDLLDGRLTIEQIDAQAR